MIDYYCWFQNIENDDYLKILENSSVCGKNNCRYDEESGELCMLTSQNKSQINNIDDIFNDLEQILDKRVECHIKAHDAKSKLELSVIQQNGIRSIRK